MSTAQTPTPTPIPARVQWRKSSHSSDTGGDCVECATLGSAAWRKSSYSGDTGGDCVEVADLPHAVAVRDSKRPEGPAFTVSPGAFEAFVWGAANGLMH
ncbi:DUF397 domain-containing protein [Streptomyces mirabilis]|uniref:DUF397 domain-containing protein n=1 Tax=Streptomyces mirabilis TaxID=68239 RepID=UPI0021BF179E|nr:DUF397 domain-containing protein [Streptomyces mirabilis]MCT9112249.1 DUF397 domain-containing protein [Streptomyces mirabilis]